MKKNKTRADRKSTSSVSRLSNPWYFFSLALGWSWFFWILAILLGTGVKTALGIVLALLGLLGPLVAGISSVYTTRDKTVRRDYWRRITDVKKIGTKWYIVIFLFAPVLTALAFALDILAGGSGAAWEEPAVRFISAPWTIIPFILSILLVGPMEEFGWRGYVLDRLQEKWSALSSGLILGCVWSLWHLPLFFIPDTYQYNLGAGSASFWLFMLGIVPLSVLFTWIFNNTARSTLAAMLFHFMINFTGELVALTPRAEFYSILLWTVAAVGVTAIGGRRTLSLGRPAQRK